MHLLLIMKNLGIPFAALHSWQVLEMILEENESTLSYTQMHIGNKFICWISAYPFGGSREKVGFMSK